MTGEATLSDRAIFIRSTISSCAPRSTPASTKRADCQRTNLVRTVVFVVTLAVPALEARLNLSTDTDPVALLDLGDLGASPDGAANYFVTDAERKRVIAPTAVKGVDIAATHAAALDLNVNVVILERFRLDLELLKVAPIRLRRHLVAFKTVWKHHDRRNCTQKTAGFGMEQLLTD